MHKRVYKFISARYAISNLQNKRLKLSTIEDLNDPFDLCPVDTSDPAFAEAVNDLAADFKHRWAILCFSRNWDNLLMWSHYGDSHRGVCLGFDIPQGESGVNYDTDVLYQPNVLPAPRRREDLNLDFMGRLHRTKHESWSYEQEVRMYVQVNDPPAGSFRRCPQCGRRVPDDNNFTWIDFGPLLALWEVIIGSQCHPKDSKMVEEAVEPYGADVRCRWAGMRPDAFVLDKLDRPPWWHATVK
jgi:hypothetical protein